MKVNRYSYKNYKDDRDCFTRKILNRSMYIILNEKKKPLVHKEGNLLIFYRLREAIDYISSYSSEDAWKVKKVKIDVTTL
jgi:DNA-directed RNA polymerase subunit F